MAIQASKIVCVKGRASVRGASEIVFKRPEIAGIQLVFYWLAFTLLPIL